MGTIVSSKVFAGTVPQRIEKRDAAIAALGSRLVEVVRSWRLIGVSEREPANSHFSYTFPLRASGTCAARRVLSGTRSPAPMSIPAISVWLIVGRIHGLPQDSGHILRSDGSSQLERRCILS